MLYFNLLLRISLICLLLSEVACTLLPSTPKRIYQVTPQIHIVQRGDTLSKISQRYQSNMYLIARLNGLNPPYLIYPGQRLQLNQTISVVPNISVLPMGQRSIQLPNKPSSQIQFPIARSPTTSVKKQIPNTINITQPIPIRLPPTTQQQRCSPPIDWQWPAIGSAIEQTAISGKRGLEIFGYLGQPIKASAAGQVIYSDNGVNGYRNLIIIQHNAAYLSAYANNRILLVSEGSYVTARQIIAEMGTNADHQASLHFEIRCYTKTLDPLPYLPK